MTGLDWGSPELVLACQLICAGVLAADLLVLRPRAARLDLLLDARVVQDELDLAERLGHVDPLNVETIAVHQLLRRVRQNPGSARLVLARIPALARAAAASTKPADVEYLGGALDRLSDAAHRYLRTAWPRAATLTATVATPIPIWDEHEPQLEPDDDQELPDEVLYLDDLLDADDLDEAFDADLDGAEPVDVTLDDVAVAPDRELDRELDRESDRELDRESEREAPGGPELALTPGSTAWVDLVQAETPRRSSGLGLADRHARPYRPARSSSHSAARRSEPPDRSSVLPR